MKNNIYTIIPAIFCVIAAVLDILAILAFSTWNNSALGSVFLSSGSALLLFGIAIMRKGNDGK